MKLEELIEQAKNLPPSPQILPKLLTVLQDGNASYWEMAQLIQLDQALTTQVLAWSNSGYYGYASKSLNIEEAIGRVGVNEIYKLVGIVMGKRLMDRPVTCYALDPGQLWENSLATAFTMERIGARVNEDLNLSYTAGLLHGIGKIVINEVCGKEYEEVYRKVQEEGMSLVGAEEAVIGYNHAQIGGALLKKWGFGEEICEGIEYQYEPYKKEKVVRVGKMLHLGNFMVVGMGKNWGRDAMAMEFNDKVVEELGIKRDEVELLMVEALEVFEAVKKQLAGS